MSERRISACTEAASASVGDASGDRTRRFKIAPLIVVGVDGSDESRSALRWALEEARLRGAALRVVHAWYAYPAMGDRASGVATDWDALVAGANSFVESFARDTVGVPQGVELEAVAVHGTAAAALIEAAQEAQLLVVGARGHGGFTGLLLGSVSQQCVHHAPCPVVVIRGAPVEPKDLHEATAGTRAVSFIAPQAAVQDPARPVVPGALRRLEDIHGRSQPGSTAGVGGAT